MAINKITRSRITCLDQTQHVQTLFKDVVDLQSSLATIFCRILLFWCVLFSPLFCWWMASSKVVRIFSTINSKWRLVSKQKSCLTLQSGNQYRRASNWNSHSVLGQRYYLHGFYSLNCSRTLCTDCFVKFARPNYGTIGGIHSIFPYSTATNSASISDAEEKEKVKAKSIRNTKLGLLSLCGVFFAAGVILVVEYGAPTKDENGNNVHDEFSDKFIVLQYLLRTWRELKSWNTLIKEPSREKLLPDPLKEPYVQPPYTLVLELTGVLVNPEWTYQTGWRFKKRPAVDFFVSQVGFPMFEVVIFTAEQGFTAFPIIDSLDPNQMCVMYRLFRDATKYMNGHHVKDLSRLNRDLSKVIYVDWDPKSFQLQPENALRIPKWEGADDDTGLVDLAGLLRTIAVSNVEDVRTVLEYYNGFDNPLHKFRENQKLLEAEQQQLMAAEANKPLTKNWTGRLFGYKRHTSV